MKSEKKLLLLNFLCLFAHVCGESSLRFLVRGCLTASCSRPYLDNATKLFLNCSNDTQTQIVQTPGSFAVGKMIDLANKDSGYDLLETDVIWSRELRDRLVSLGAKNLTGGFSPSLELTQNANATDFTPGDLQTGMLAAYSYGEQFKAFPMYADFGVLLYRKDLLRNRSLPTTYSELTTLVKDILAEEKNKDNSWVADGFLFAGNQDESLTCIFLEWVYSHGGGSLVESAANGVKVTLNNPAAAKALEQVRTWLSIGGISSRRTLELSDSDVLQAAKADGAIFTRTWASAVLSLDLNREKFGLAPLPGGVPDKAGTGTLGGFGVAVHKNSPNLAKSLAYAAFLSTKAQELTRMRLAQQYPPSGFNKSSICGPSDQLSSSPQLNECDWPNISAVQIVPRFSHLVDSYSKASYIIQKSLAEFLSGDQPTTDFLAELECDLVAGLILQGAVVVSPPTRCTGSVSVPVQVVVVLMSALLVGGGYLLWRKSRGKRSASWMHLLVKESVLTILLIFSELSDVTADAANFFYVKTQQDLGYLYLYYLAAFTVCCIASGFIIVRHVLRFRAIRARKVHKGSIAELSEEEAGGPSKDNSATGGMTTGDYLSQTYHTSQRASLTILSALAEDVPFIVLSLAVQMDPDRKGNDHVVLISMIWNSFMLGTKVMSLRVKTLVKQHRSIVSNVLEATTRNANASIALSELSSKNVSDSSGGSRGPL